MRVRRVGAPPAAGASRPFRPLAKKAFFSKADAIELPSYPTLDAAFPSA